MLSRRPGTRPFRELVQQRWPGMAWLLVLCAALSCLAACGPAAARPAGAGRALGANPDVDPGTPLGGRPAPGFRLVNQFGQPMSLRQFRGKVVLLAFIDSTCTNVCPLTTAAMTEVKGLLGRAGGQVRLLAVDANPHAAAVGDIRAYSRAHGMLNQWDFLTGSPAQLAAVWKAYGMAVQIRHGLIDHTPALFVIGPGGGEQRVYLTQLAYAGISQSAHDTTGRVADGYSVQDQPWFVLLTASGKIVWHHDGWLPPAALAAAAARRG